jgi:hypothetical protein
MSRALRSALPSALRAPLPVGLLVALLVVLLAGPALAVDVAVTEDGVDPDPVIAEVGEQVTFVNETDDDVRLIDDEGRWDSGDLSPGESFTITFDLPGTVTFTSADGAFSGTIEVGQDPTTPVTDEPVDEATAEPIDEPTEEPTEEPTAEPTAEATDEATDEAAGPTPEATPSEAPTGLAETGAPAGALLVAALAALGGGLLLLRPARSRG